MNATRRTLAITAAVLGGGAALAGAWVATPCTQLAQEIEIGRDHITAVETAELLMQGRSGVRIFDLRSAAEFDEFHIPGAARTSITELSKAELPHHVPIVIYSAGGAHAAQAWTLLRLRGYRDVFFLREGVYEWMATVVEPQLASDATPRERVQFKRAEVLSRFFGGSATVDVPRADLRPGYWTGAPNAGTTVAQAESADQRAVTRRRGC